MRTRAHLLTEQQLDASRGLDAMNVEQMLAVMDAENARAVAAVSAERSAIARAAEMVVKAIASGGRLIYVGAGTSGGLAMLDAAEVPGTYGIPAEQVQAIFAGGLDAAGQFADTAAEDSFADGEKAIDERGVGPRDVVMGIAAGGTTPFVHGALAAAKRRGGRTIFYCCVQPFEGEPSVDLTIRTLTGPEVVTGSTRMKAGTATKLVLNAITTAAMVRLGQVYDNLLVELHAGGCAKVRDRGARIIATITGIDPEQALLLLDQAGGSVKQAIVMQQAGVSAGDASALLERHRGRLRPAIEAPVSRA